MGEESLILRLLLLTSSDRSGHNSELANVFLVRVTESEVPLRTQEKVLLHSGFVV